MNKIYRLYIAEYEKCETWLSSGGKSSFLKYLNPYDLFVVYMTGRSKLPFDSYRRTLDNAGDQCIFVDARQMSDPDLHEHMLAQINKYSNANTHIYFLCNLEDYQALRGRIETGIEVSYKQNYRTGKIEIPASEDEEPAPFPPKAEATEICADVGSNSFTDEGPDNQAPPGQESAPPPKEPDAPVIPVNEVPAPEAADSAVKKETEENPNPEAPKQGGGKKKKPLKKKPSDGQGNHISNAPMDAFMTMFGGKIGDESQRAPGSTPAPKKEPKKEHPKADSQKQEDPSDAHREKTDNQNIRKDSPKKKPRFPKPNAEPRPKKEEKKELNSSDAEPKSTGQRDPMPEQDWVTRISGTEKAPVRNKGSKIQDIEKAIFGTKQASFDIEKQYTALDDSKAKTVSLMADRLINDIKLLIKGIDKYKFSYDEYMELISTLIRSDDLNDFTEGWSIVHPGCDLNLSEQIYQSLYKEACHYARVCEVLYSEDYW